MRWHFFNTYTKERLGLIVFLFLMITGAIMLHYLPQWKWKQQKSLIITLKEVELKDDTINTSKDFITQYTPSKKEIPFSHHSVNPNTADATTWMALGLSEKQAKVIINYRNKGGKFYSINDLNKIYVLDQRHIDNMAPYLLFESFKTTTPSKPYAPTAKTPIPSIAINTASAQELEQVKGIGPVLSKRIINFRNQLGGFHSPNQIMEVYHIPEEAAQALMEVVRLNINEVKKININEATSSELYAHPYLRPYQKQILKHIATHGKVNKIEELKQILLINDEIFRKIAPYIAL